MVLLLLYRMVIFLYLVLDKCFDTKAAKLKRDKTITFCYHALQEVSHLEMKNWGPDATNTYITDYAFSCMTSAKEFNEATHMSKIWHVMVTGPMP